MTMNNSSHDLYLYELFSQLRKAGFPLGICDYNLLSDALSTNIYDPLEPESLKQLVKTIWVKTNSQRQQFEKIFDQVLPQKSPSVIKSSEPVKSDSSKSSEIEKTITHTPSVTRTTSKGKSFAFPATSQAGSGSETEDSGEHGKAVKTGQSDYVAFRRTKNSDDYLPVTGEQMVQGWYNLKRSIRTGTKLELDVAATIEQIKSQGKFVLPVLQPRRLKYSSLLLLIDQRGSMQPFHVLSRQLVATARQTGCLTSHSCYYFHNYPNSEFYCDSQFNSEISVEEVLASLSSQHTVVLIFSDAGAARRDYIPRRIRETKDFLMKLKQQVKAIVWLNPVPKSAWEETTAEAISKLNNIKMFPADSKGFQQAIEVLK